MHNIKNCNGCMNCILKCPTSAISLAVKEENIRIDNFKCITCMICIDACPIQAITISNETIPETRYSDFKCNINKKRLNLFNFKKI